MTATASRVLVLSLAILALAGVWRAVSAERERRELARVQRETQQLVAQLEGERAQLTSELFTAKQTIRGQADDLAGYRHELELAQQRLQRAAAELAALQQQEEALLARNTALTNDMSDITTQKQLLEAKLSSIDGLRRAIREAKHRMWEQRVASWRDRLQAAREEDQQQLALGNRGYVVHDGASTLASAASPRLHVHVLEPETQ